MIEQIEQAGYNIKALVSDGHASLLALTQPTTPPWRKGTQPYPRPGIKPAIPKKPKLFGVPHQLCVVHFLRDVDRLLKYKKTKNPLSKKLRYRIKRMLEAKTLKSFEHRYKLVTKCEVKTQAQRTVLLRVKKYKDLLSTHLRQKSFSERSKRLYMPSSTNSIERVNSKFEARLGSMKKFKSRGYAEDFVQLIALKFRISSFTRIKNKYKRGKSRIELAGGKKLTLRQLFGKRPATG